MDTTPDAITFTNQSGNAVSTAVSSNQVTITGINAAAAISITGGEYSINGGAFTSASGTVSNNQTVTVRVNSPAQFSTQASATLTVGGVAAVFTVTTVAADPTPDAFQFQNGVNAARGVVVTSDNVTITGLNTSSPVTITGGEYSIEGGAFTSGAGTLTNNQRVQLRVTSSGQFSTPANATLSVGGVTGTFTVTTLAEDTTPDAFEFQRVANATFNSLVTSNSVTITGINNTTPVSIQNGEFSVAGGPFRTAAATVQPGQSLVVRTRAATVYSKSARARVTVGNVTADFEVSAELPLYTPDDVDFDGTTVYLLDSQHRLIFRWLLAEARYLDPYELPQAQLTPSGMAYSSSHQRVYLGYTNGAITYFDPAAANPVEVGFASMASGVYGLSSAGNFLIGQAAAYSGIYVFGSNGTVTAQGGYYGYSRRSTWDPNTSRLYYTRDGTSPNDLHYDVINQATGSITSTGETPYHGSYNIQAPIRVSVNGEYVLLGSGDIYNRNGLTWSASLGSQVADARWSANGSLVTLTTTATTNPNTNTTTNQTVLRRLAATNLAALEQMPIPGRALRVIGTDDRMAVVMRNDNGTVQIHVYVPSDDSDGDGVPNTEDAFPLDRAASLDTDQDGYPDAWNTGRGPSDSTTGLALDAFPQDSACWLASHGSGGACDYSATLPDYEPDQIVQQGDIVYLLSRSNLRVYRWSISTERYLNPYVVGIKQGFTTLAPTKIAVSAAHQRLYLGYETGAIRYIDLAGSSPAEIHFSNLAMSVNGLASVGNYMLAQDSSGAWESHYVINSAGVITDWAEWNHYSPEYTWDPNTSRVYFFSMWSPADLNYEVIDQATGQITSAGETPYHGTYSIVPPIRVSANGQHILLGSGDIYARSSLTWSGSTGSPLADARWFAGGSVVTLTTSNNQTVLRRLSATNLATIEQLPFTGRALRVVGSDTRMALVLVENGTVQFRIYVPSDDSDGDGSLNTVDAFPLDRAASVDNDGDGYPDAWNAGRSQADSTTIPPLSLDAFPNDSACWLPAHGSGGVCNYAATMPAYVPDQLAHNGDIVYLLSAANRRVYRWSISQGAYLNPYVVGINQGFSTVAPISMAFSSGHGGRLYLGYSSGAVRYMDVNAATPVETAFVNLPAAVPRLTSAGNFLHAKGDTGYVINSSGVITASGGGYGVSSRDVAFDPVSSRIYFFTDGYSPNDLYFDTIDQATGLLGASGETPYHGAYTIAPPIRSSVDGQYVLLGSGDIYNRTGLTWAGSLGAEHAEARWFANGTLLTMANSTSQTTLRRLGGSNLRTVLEQFTINGQALRVFGTDSAMVLVLVNNGAVQFRNYVPDDDSDDDGVDNAADAFPLDRAASVDTDRDGYPDAWNAGRTQADSTSVPPLSLDSFPNDAACWLPAHGSGGVCNYGATIPNYIPDQVVSHGDVIYLLNAAARRVYRRSISTGQYLNPYIVGIDQGVSTLAPAKMTYSSAHQRLYFGYSTGAIRYIDVTAGNPVEVPFANVSASVGGLASVGNFVLAQDGAGAWETHYIFNSAGVITDQEEWNHYSPEYAWDPNTSRVYWFSMWSPGDLNYEVIDQVTGQITATAETPYHGSYSIMPPIRVSGNGQYVLLGSGDIYNQAGLTWAGSVGMQVAEARWFADGTLLTLATSNNQTTLRRLGGATLTTTLEQLNYTGQALRVFGTDTAMVLLLISNGTVQFHNYVPDDDSDDDGVDNLTDAFPLDRAASVDTDRDGYPDAWNAGRSQADSTSVPPLSLDSFPNDSACWLPAHGSGGVCNYGATIPNYTPDQVATAGDVIYLLSNANRRVYRWSMATGSYLNPYVIGLNQGFNTIAPTEMAWSAAHQRLYFGYSTGAIRYIDVTAGSPAETPFANIAMGVNGLVAVGNYVLAQDFSGAWATHYVINSAGIITDQEEWNYSSPDYAWDPVNSRVYFFRDHSPSDLMYEVINQANGQITGEGETPYHNSYGWTGPIRVSGNGDYVMLGGGSIYSQAGMTLWGSMSAFRDARWTDDLMVVLRTDDEVEIRDPDSHQLLMSYPYTGAPLALAFGQTETYLVHVVNNTTAFVRLAFFDQDGDSIVRWWEQAYGLSDANPADATADPDGDGVSNLDEYLNHSRPDAADTDADGLNDFQEIVTHDTNPRRADSDGDGLNDYAEVITHNTDPWDTDSDNDGFTDHDEVLYGGNPNDSTGLPQPMSSYNQTFEGTPDLAAWTTPQQSSGAWVVDTTDRHGGAASFRSGAISNLQTSSVRFRGFFRAGTLTFWARADIGGCCSRFEVLRDGSSVVNTGSLSGGWNQFSVQIPTQGIRTLEFRYVKDLVYSQGADAIWIDDVVFTAQ